MDTRTTLYRGSIGNPSTHSIDCSLTVSDIMARHPSTRQILDRFGVDTCFDASLSVEEAARSRALDGVALCAALREAAGA